MPREGFKPAIPVTKLPQTYALDRAATFHQTHNAPIEAQGERMPSSYSFSTSALNGMSGQRHTPAALYPRERTRGTHCTGGWEDPRAGLDTEVRGEIICPCTGSNLDRPVFQPLARHYTD
jgi:hypothetical protein